MSLKLAAQHMASRGRGPDTQLIHMAPQEVAGLQALAKARGGSLTVNPDTGLAEAGFLKNILPMVIGAGLAAATGGTSLALTPGMIGLGIGGVETLRTGSLQKGLMAGLGAYGGAGLAGGLMGAGAAGAGTGTGLTATGGVMGANPMVAQPMTFGAETLGTGVGAGSGVVVNPVPLTPSAEIAGALPEAPSLAQNLNLQAQQQAAQAFTGGAPQVQTATPMAGREAFMGKEGVGGGMGLMKYGLAGLAPMLMQEQKQAARDERKPFEYTYDPGRVEDPQAGYTGAYTGERTYFNPMFTRTAADGGMMDSGPLQALSDRSEAETLLANGGQRFAEGGETKAVKPVEQDPYYTMSGQSGDAFKYLMGQMPTAPRAAPVMAPTPPAAVSGGVNNASGTTVRPYSFDPATGAFTAMPIAAPSPASAFVGGFDPGSGDGGVGTAGDGYAQGGIAALAQGGQSHLGDYSDGGRLLKGPGDGVSDSIPATIANKRPARLADGEFVVPARIVSELGNGSTEAGARKLYAMMDRIQKARGKTTGKNRVAVNSRSETLLPA